MSIIRRHFLLSTAGASVVEIVPDYYFRALEFFERFDEPLLEPPPQPMGARSMELRMERVMGIEPT